MARSVSHPDWTDVIYVEHAKIYQRVLENGLKTAPAEVDGIVKAFRRHGITRGRVLDVACGIGRHSVYLARRGYDVTGFDYSQTFLSRASLLAKDLGVEDRTRFIQGEFSRILSALPQKESFDAIIMMDSSMGVTTKDEDDLKLFRRLRSLTAKNGLFLVENFDREIVAKQFQYVILQRFPKNTVRVWESLSRPGDPIYESRWTFYEEKPNGDLQHLLTSKQKARHYSKKELSLLLEDAGWRLISCFGDLGKLRPAGPDDARTFLLLAKA